MSQSAPPGRSAAPPAVRLAVAAQGGAGAGRPGDPRPAAVGVLPPHQDGVLAGMRSRLAGTPGRLWIALAVALVAALAFALVGGDAFLTRSDRLGAARAQVQQLVRVQEIRSSLETADAAATNAFLVGGLPPAGQREAYLAALDTASTDLTAASGADATDARGLAPVAGAVVRYAGLVESARANNRQGFPVGAAYLRQASALLRAEALEPLSAIVDADAARVSSDLAAARDSTALLLIAAGIGLVLIVGVQVWVAAHSHRYLNTPMLVASAVLLCVAAAGLGTMTVAQSRVSDVRDHSYAAALAVAQARIAGFDAKAAESLTLVNRGSGAADEKQWQQDAATVRAELSVAAKAGVDSQASTRFEAYAGVHTAIRTLDDTQGRWDDAVTRATSAAANGGNGTFAAFDSVTAQILTDREHAAVDGLDSPRIWLVVLGWLTVCAGLAAALLSARGVGQRLAEYR